MEILSKKNAYWGTVPIPPNTHFTVPDFIGAALCNRGMAEDVTAVMGEMEAAKKKPKPKAKD